MGHARLSQASARSAGKTGSRRVGDPPGAIRRTRADERFGPVRATDVRSLAGPVVDVEVPAGTELVREGVPIGTFFVIRSGSAELFRDGHHVGTLGTGDCFGEIDPHGGESQGYGIITSAPTRLLTFSAFGIERLCEAIPGDPRRADPRAPARSNGQPPRGATRWPETSVATAARRRSSRWTTAPRPPPATHPDPPRALTSRRRPRRSRQRSTGSSTVIVR